MKKLISLLLVVCMACTLFVVHAEELPVYVALGDSITTGYGLAEGEKGFAEIVAETNGYALRNHAINGNTSDGILAQMADPAVLADIISAELITITCGGNDLMGQLYQQLAAVYQANVPEGTPEIKPEEFATIMEDPNDPRQQAIMLAVQTVLAGDAEKGIAPFVQGDAMKQAITTYLQNLGAVMAVIRKMNPDVMVIVATQYNPYGTFTGDYEGLNTAFNAGAMVLSQFITEYGIALGYKTADVYTAFAASGENLMNANMETMNLDFHPNAAGHAVIAQCMNAVLNPQTSAVDYPALLQEAMTFTIPLMMVKATEIKVTNAETAGYTQAPVNQLVQVPILANATAKDVVTPNVDTLYTQAFLDLYQDAVIMELPRSDRFSIMQFMDAYTNTIAIIDCMQLAEGGEKFIFTGPYWKGEVPEGMTQIKCPTCMVWLLGRTIASDDVDAANARAVQKQMDMYTLTAYLNGTEADKPKGEYVEAENFIPRNFVLSRTMEQYFDLANKLMLLNPPAAADAPVLARIAAIGVGPGMDFDPSMFGTEEEVAALWQQTMQGVFTQATIASARFQVANGPWKMGGDPIADWGTEYGYRAGVALVALGANPTYMALYPNTSVDSEGNALVGTEKYIIHMDADAFPPMHENGFWSITAYNSVNYLIDNELGRYAIKNNTTYILNEDGSLDIYVQAEKPTDEKQLANWLPVSEDAFQLFLRVYLPQDSMLNNEWPMPSITRVTAE